MALEYLQIQNKLGQAFAFQPVGHESGIFLVFAMIYHATRNQRGFDKTLTPGQLTPY